MRVVELFAGAGGAALGLKAAGCAHSAYVEWDADACATMRAAGMGGVYEGDVREWVARETSSTSRHACDLLWSSFPCQAFSQAGKRLGAKDERNGWPWTVDAIDVCRPTWFIAENVRGLTMHKKAAACDLAGSNPEECPGCYLHGVILPDLRKRFAWVDMRVLNAADYGVPQTRRRLIIVAGPRPIEWPAPTHANPKTLGAALGLPFGARSSAQTGGAKHPDNVPERPARTIRSGGNGHSAPPQWLSPWVSMGEALGLRIEDSEERRGNRNRGGDEPCRTVSGKGNTMVRIIGGGRNPQAPGIPRSYRDLTEEPCTTVAATRSITVVASEYKGSSPAVAHKRNRASDLLCAATGRRRLTERECAILQDFPPDHPFQGNKTSVYRQIGNAVPPKLAEVVARAVISAHEGEE